MAAKYSMPVRINFGEGIRKILPELECVKRADKISIYTGSSSLKKSGRLDEILMMLKGKKVRVVEGISPEPEVEELLRETESERQAETQCVVAIGGGSVLDLAKTVSYFATQKGDPVSLLKNFPEKPVAPIPVVAVPTTAGTGSEVTSFVVFWDKKGKKKYPSLPAIFYATEALVDPELTYTMPPGVTASTGMDAFTQACEAYWNRDHQPVSDDYALAAVRRIFSSLPEAVKNGDDKKARFEMMLGSLEGGLAFSNTRTTACHSISYPITARFGVSHGQAVGITLPSVLILNSEVMPERVGRFISTLGAGSAQEASEKIKKMMTAAGLKTRLSELNINASDVDLIVKEGFTPERMGNNPYIFDADSLKKMLLTIL